MARRVRRLSINKNLAFALVFPIVIGSFLPHSYGEETRTVKYGFSIFGGLGDVWHNEVNLTAYGFLPRVDLPLLRKWDLEFEGNYSSWNIRKEHDLYFLGVDANLVFKPIQRTWGSVFLLAGGGLGYDSAGKRVPQVGDSHCGGILQAGTGFYYNLGKRLALRIEYRLYHISDPFRSDQGLNTHTVLLGISF